MPSPTADRPQLGPPFHGTRLRAGAKRRPGGAWAWAVLDYSIV